MTFGAAANHLDRVLAGSVLPVSFARINLAGEAAAYFS